MDHVTGPNKHQSAVTCLQFNNKFVITSSDDGTVKLWDVRTGMDIKYPNLWNIYIPMSCFLQEILYVILLLLTLAGLVGLSGELGRLLMIATNLLID